MFESGWRLIVRGEDLLRVFWKATEHVLECVGTIDRRQIGHRKRPRYCRWTLIDAMRAGMLRDNGAVKKYSSTLNAPRRNPRATCNRRAAYLRFLLCIYGTFLKIRFGRWRVQTHSSTCLVTFQNTLGIVLSSPDTSLSSLSKTLT